MHHSSTHITISFSRGWVVTFAAAGLGLVFGILYVWSVIKGGIPDIWGWSNADKALPYSTMAVIFSFIMVPAGQFQDRFGPRPAIMLGGLLAGAGCIIAGFGGSSLTAYIIGFGIITGTGVGLAYASLTPAAMKWFPAEKTGITVGIVVSGAGLAPLPLAPFTAWLLNFFSTTTPQGEVMPGISAAMITLGITIWIAVFCLAWFVYNPPPGFVPMSRYSKTNAPALQEFNWKQMMATPQFWLLFFMYFSGASAGLVFISVAADFGRQALGQWAFLAVVVLSLGNTLGRILGGILSDKIGRPLTLCGAFLCQASVIGILYGLTRSGGASWPVILMVVFMIGLNYGANLTIFPAACKDHFGIRNFGFNYGWLFTAFGAAGLIMPWVNGLIRDITGKPDISYLLIISMLALSAILALITRRIGQPVIQTQRGNQ